MIMQLPGGKKIPAALLPVCDILAAGVCLVAFAYFHHVRSTAGENDITKLPQSVIPPSSSSVQYGSEAQTTTPDGYGSTVTTPSGEYEFTTAPEEQSDASETPAGITDVPQESTVSPQPGKETTPPADITDAPKPVETTAVTAPPADLSGWGYKWPDKFSTDNQVYSGADSYKSHNVNLTIKKYQGNNVTYYVQDIYIRKIDNLKTAFAQDTYGKGFTDRPENMTAAHNAICGVNGDFYGNRENGIIIRNYVCYRDTPRGDVCAIYYDGTMKNFSKSEFNTEAEMNNGVYQTFSFGPALIKDGVTIQGISNSVSGLNPRTGIGYYEPGHYCFVTVDGRDSDGYSVGVTLDEFAKIFEKLGCAQAYNLDGGRSAVMVYQNKAVNQPYEGGRKTSDIVYICD